MPEKQNIPWKDRPTAEKTALIIGWCAIAILMVYWVLPNKPEPTVPPDSIESEVQRPTARYTRASAQALADATQYLSKLDSAMAQSAQMLEANNLAELSAHSRVFKSLLEDGRVQFGHSVFQPLGRCSSAAIFANSWWQAQVSAARQGGKETTLGAIQSNLDEYNANRAECLKSATPSIDTATTHEQNADGGECLTSFTVDSKTKEELLSCPGLSQS